MRTNQESKIEKRLCEGIDKLGGLHYKFTSPAHRSVPDRIVFYNTRKGLIVHLIEVKTTYGNLQKHQARELKKLRKNGVTCHVLKGSDAVDEYLAYVNYSLSVIKNEYENLQNISFL